jgi:hypothetical protein
VDIQSARGHLMQGRLPDVEEVLVDERDVTRTVAPPEPGGEFKTAGATANDNDFVVYA